MTTRPRQRRRRRSASRSSGRYSPVGRQARTLALQILYAYDIAGGVSDAGSFDPAALVEWLCDGEPATPSVRRHAAAMAAGVIASASDLDDAIQGYAPALPVNLLAVVDRNILRVAIYELTRRAAQVPRAVVVNEAVELASMYGSESSARFVNGVLGSAVNDLPDDDDAAGVNADADSDTVADADNDADADAAIDVDNAGSCQSE